MSIPQVALGCKRCNQFERLLRRAQESADRSLKTHPEFWPLSSAPRE